METQSHREPKVPLPDKFDGSRQEYRAFISQMELVFMLNPSRYPNDAAKVGTIGTLLTGKARQWFTPFIEKAKDYSHVLNDYAAFRVLMDSCFSDPDRAVTASNKIRRLYQGRRPAAHYAADFRSLSVDLDWNDASLMDQYRHGLNDSVKDMLIHYPIPASLDALMALSIQLDNRIFERRSEKNQDFDRRPQASPTPVQALEPAAMEIDAIHRGPLPEAEKRRRRDNHLCLYCGSNQHLRAACPVAKKRPAGLNAMNSRFKTSGNGSSQ